MEYLQYIQDGCLISVLINSIFTGYNYAGFSFSWDRIKDHPAFYDIDYNHKDAQSLLQLSLMVTESNWFNKPINPPFWIHDTELNYTKCPLGLLAEEIPSSPINKPANLGYIFYAEGANILFIIFTGTSNVCMAGLDLAYGQDELTDINNYVSGLKGHYGIYSGYKSIRDKLIETIKEYLPRNPQIIISGHSLGGALSQICALDLAEYNPIHYSFAAPMVFNETGYLIFTKLVPKSFRIANISDLVVFFPLPVMNNKDRFFHVGKLIHFQRNLGSFPLNHSTAYVQEYDL